MSGPMPIAMLVPAGWVIALAAIVGLILLGWIANSLGMVGHRPRRIYATETPPVDSDEFLKALSGGVNAPIGSGGRAILLNNGDAFFPVLLAALHAAERAIDFSVYFWEDGRISHGVLDALSERAQAGVQVRVLLDEIGARKAPKDGLERLCAAGARVRHARPLRFGRMPRFHKRNHRRAIVIDGNVGFTGGASIADKWWGDARGPDEWRDYWVLLTGNLAASLQSAFAEAWAHTCGEIVIGPDFYAGDRESEAARRALTIALRSNGAARNARESSNAHSAPIRFVQLSSTPAREEHPLRLFWSLSFLCARHRIVITTPYFVPDAQVRHLMAERARAGVDVRILVQGPRYNAGLVRRAAHSCYTELLEAGVRIFEYLPTQLHCKHLVVDGCWSIIGSANMDIRSQTLNQEIVIGLVDRDFGTALERTFTADLERAEEIDLDLWRRRPLGARICERFWALFAKQL